MSGWHGPVIAEDGVEFRLWAPDAAQVDLVVAGEAPRAMLHDARGLYRLTVAGAAAGTRYHFLIDGVRRVPDPASRFQPDGAEGDSMVVDTAALAQGAAFAGRPWAEAVIYELHVGTFSPEGTYAGVERQLDALRDLGITAIELMTLNDIPGTRNWGYDGVLLYAPKAAYGTPQALRQLIDAAHARGIMVYLDVVYNHFGPSGNHLGSYAGAFFNPFFATVWGPALNLEGEDGALVQDFLIHNARQWVCDYGFDGLRFDAVQALKDRSETHFLVKLATAIRAAAPDRIVHLMLENEYNEASRLERDQGVARQYDAQWNDDYHNALHVLLTGETGGYYVAYADKPLWYLTRSLTEGFAFQGEVFANSGHARGQPSAHLPPEATIVYTQNHDQVGNRAFGERFVTLAGIDKTRLAMAMLLLQPHIPMLFMGEEFLSTTPFLFFCDWQGELADATRAGRKREFGFAEDAADAMPDPCAPESFAASRIDWARPGQPEAAAFVQMVRDLLTLRRQVVVPMIAQGFRRAVMTALPDPAARQGVIELAWQTDTAALRWTVNLSDRSVPMPAVDPASIIWASAGAAAGQLGPWQMVASVGSY